MRKIMIFIPAFLIFQMFVELSFALTLFPHTSFNLTAAVQIEGTNAKLEYVTPSKTEALLYILSGDRLEGVMNINEINEIAGVPIFGQSYYSSDPTPYVHLISNVLDTYNIALKNVNENYLSLEVNEAPLLTDRNIVLSFSGDDVYTEFDVFVDGVFYGKKTKGSLTVGFEIKRRSPHIITVSKDGYCAWHSVVGPQGADVYMYKETWCKQTPAKIFLIVDQINTNVYVDGEFFEASKDSLIILKTLSGNHTVRLTKEGFEDWSQSFRITEGNIKFINVHLPPILDSDGDGISDSQDSCPNTPSGKTVDSKGCAQSQLDSDGDGVTNDVDQCPTQAEVFNNYQDFDGCPDVKPLQDDDGDGIINENDACPDKPENFNNYQDTDGCPDIVPTTTPASYDDSSTHNHSATDYACSKIRRENRNYFARRYSNYGQGAHCFNRKTTHRPNRTCFHG